VKRRSSAAKRGCKTRRRLKTIEVMAGSPAAAQSLEELDLLRRFGVFVVAAWRGDLYFSTLPPDFQPESRDRLVLSGHEEELTDCEALFQGPPTACF
jgi:uncharacterized protein with PhoU and TrkA domain